MAFAMELAHAVFKRSSSKAGTLIQGLLEDE